MAAYEEDQIEFSILSLTKDPSIELIDKLSANVKSLGIVKEHIDADGSAGSAAGLVSSVLENILLDADASYSLTQESIDHAVITAGEEERYQNSSIDELVQHLQKLSERQIELRASIKEEQQSRQADDDYAAGRRYDYGPAVRTWIRMLARKRKFDSLQ